MLGPVALEVLDQLLAATSRWWLDSAEVPFSRGIPTVAATEVTNAMTILKPQSQKLDLLLCQLGWKPGLLGSSGEKL